jgi:hypothetical protein
MRRHCKPRHNQWDTHFFPYFVSDDLSHRNAHHIAHHIAYDITHRSAHRRLLSPETAIQLHGQLPVTDNSC